MGDCTTKTGGHTAGVNEIEPRRINADRIGTYVIFPSKIKKMKPKDLILAIRAGRPKNLTAHLPDETSVAKFKYILRHCKDFSGLRLILGELPTWCRRRRYPDPDVDLDADPPVPDPAILNLNVLVEELLCSNLTTIWLEFQRFLFSADNEFIPSLMSLPNLKIFGFEGTTDDLMCGEVCKGLETNSTILHLYLDVPFAGLGKALWTNISISTVHYSIDPPKSNFDMPTDWLYLERFLNDETSARNRWIQTWNSPKYDAKNIFDVEKLLSEAVCDSQESSFVPTTIGIMIVEYVLDDGFL